jgi:anti-anti-sigma factor
VRPSDFGSWPRRRERPSLEPSSKRQAASSINSNGGHGGEGFSVEPVQRERDSVLVLAGEFDLTGVAEFDDAAASIVPIGSLVLDLRDLSFLDSSGLRAFMGLHRRGLEEGWSLVLAAPQPQVARVLEITGLDDRLTIVE